MIRRIFCVGAAFVTLIALCGCDPLGRPELVPKFGVRVTDGKLQIWTGSPCLGTTRIDVEFDRYGGRRAQLQLEVPSPPPLPKSVLRQDAPPRPGVQVEYFTLGGPYSGFGVTKPLPAEFDWRQAKSVDFHASGGPTGWGGSSTLAEALNASDQHPADTFWFSGLGWLGPREVAAENGKSFLALCTANPSKRRKLPKVFGVRVTDGTLRIWVGPGCRSVDDVILTFQPAQADLLLTAVALNDESFESLVATGPYPGFQVTQPLPDGFDWRTQKTVLLRVFRQHGDPWTIPTELESAVAESGQHPPDTYWFQGSGWLSPADLAGKTAHELPTVCIGEY